MKKYLDVILKSENLRIYVLSVFMVFIIIANILNGDLNISQGLILGISIMAIAIYLHYKLYLSTSILMMAFFTYLGFPLLFTVFSILISGVISGKFNMYLPFVAIFSIYAIMFLTQALKTKWSDVFLENIKISLDIIRIIFAVVLGLMTIYYLTNKNYTYFQYIIVDYSQKTPDDLKQLLQLLVQSLTFPFIILTSILRIITDSLLLRKKRGKRIPDNPVEPIVAVGKRHRSAPEQPASERIGRLR